MLAWLTPNRAAVAAWLSPCLSIYSRSSSLFTCIIMNNHEWCDMASQTCITLPNTFCWTRFGVEAGQDVNVIFARKERERSANGGIFLWGIGNSVLPSLPYLLRTASVPQAIFSPILSKPRQIDVAPGAVAIWTRARTADGCGWTLPAGSMVTSHAGRATGQHYALVCRSDRRLSLSNDTPQFRMSELANLRTGRPIGASQVTAIVRSGYSGRESGPVYRAAMMVELAAPYIIALQAPIVVATEGLARLEADIAVRSAWENAIDTAPKGQQYDLFV